MKKKALLLTIISVVIAIIIVLLNYDNILKWRYNIAVKNKDCEKIYSMVDIETGKYLTKEKYINQCKININKYNASDIKIKKHKIKDNIVKVHNNISILIPSDSKFYLDNKLISDNFISDENNIYNIFLFDKLFEGEYSIKFDNTTKEENYKIEIAQDDLKTTYEYNNEKQSIIIIGNNDCRHCTNLVDFLSTLDDNILEIKYYDIQNNEIWRVKKEFLNYFKVDSEYYPTTIIGDKYIVGYSQEMEKEYIESIYHSYRNNIKTVIK